VTNGPPSAWITSLSGPFGYRCTSGKLGDDVQRVDAIDRNNPRPARPIGHVAGTTFYP